MSVSVHVVDVCEVVGLVCLDHTDEDQRDYSKERRLKEHEESEEEEGKKRR